MNWFLLRNRDSQFLYLRNCPNSTPKVASCVINDKLYNAAPSGWRFFPREFGEIGGSRDPIQ